MSQFHGALADFRAAIHAECSLQQLRRELASMARLCPPNPADLSAVIEGLVALLDFYEEPLQYTVLAAQLESELSTIDLLAGPATIAPDLLLGAAADQGKDTRSDAMSEFLETQVDGLDTIEELAFDSANDLDAVRRRLHSLKGDAGIVGATELEVAYHRLEELLSDAVHVAEVSPVLTLVCDWARATAMSIANGEPPSRREPEWTLATMLMANHARSTANEARVADRVAPDAETLAMFADFYAESMDALVKADELLIQSESAEPDPETIDSLFRTFHTIKGLAGFLEFREIADLAHATEARLDWARNDITAFDALSADLFLRSTEQMKKLMDARRVDFEGGPHFSAPEGLNLLIQALKSKTPVAGYAELQASSPSANVAEDGGNSGGGDAATQRTRPTIVRESIKVDLTRVDKLVETIGELVIMEAMVTQSWSRRSQPNPQAQYQLAQLSKVVRDLQRQGLALRMVPLRSVFGKMHRLVRDLARRSGKEVRLELDGQDAEMDRSLAERLGDPLVHMVRNAIDHGLEPPDERKEAGKNPVGTMRLRAYHEGGSIVIELSDDGRGLNRERILTKAMERGLISETTSITDREVWELIFHPGFSTAATVTEISGRGVGMDVVKRTIEDLRGRITIDSHPGHGTTFRFLLPLTLAIIDGMLVTCGADRYVIPTLSIEESIQPKADQFHQFASGGILLDVRGETIPLVNLAGLLNVDSPSRDRPLDGLVMLIDGVNGRYGLVVDDVIGQQQVVIKHLSESINDQELFSGAAILSDGQVGLILNTTRLGPQSRATTRGVSHAC